MQAKGAKAQLLMVFESAFGQTPPSTTDAIKIPFNKTGLTAKQNLIESNTITGRRDATAPSRGNIDVNGNIVVPLDVRVIGHILKAAFGAPTTTGTEKGPYTHVFKIGDKMPSVAFEQGFTDISTYALYNGCKISKLGFSFGGDGELTASIDVMGAKETINTASIDTTPVILSAAKFSNFQAAIQEGGVTIANSKNVDLNIDFGLDGDNYCIGGSGYRADIAEGIVQTTGNIKAMFENQTLLNKAINGTKTSLKMTLTSGPHSLELSMPELVYERQTPGIDGPKGIMIDLPYRAYYDSNSDNTALKITLINDVASYV